jgi:hypothetical protein
MKKKKEKFITHEITGNEGVSAESHKERGGGGGFADRAEKEKT